MFVTGDLLLGQDVSLVGTAARVDTVSEDLWSEETDYRINLIRLRRYVKGNKETLTDPLLKREIVRLLKEADNFAKAGDYYAANLWMEAIWDLLLSETDTLDPLDGFSEAASKDEEMTASSGAARFQWRKEIITGIDLWRQRFNFTVFEADSTFLEGEGNPFTGLRLNFDYATGRRNVLQGMTFFKYSRDYLLGEATLRYAGDLSSRSRLKVENRFEGTAVYRDFDLKYIQNQSYLSFNHSFGPLSIELQEEFLLRRYARIDSSYPNYFNNTLGGFARVSPGARSLFSLGYRNVQRNHPEFDINNYREHRLEASWSQSLGRWFNYSLENEFRVRDYQNVPVDHFFQDFWENYFLGEMEIGFGPKMGMKLEGSFIKREYQFHTVNSLPDDFYWEIEPEVYLKIADNWKVGVGVHYGRQTHEPFPAAARLTAVDVASVVSVSFENYREYGPVVTVDFFEINGILFSLRESFLLRRYPDTPTGNINQFNLYSDRNTNSLLLFLTWPLSKHWQLNVLANMDDDRSQKDNSGDSQNTLVDIEISYSF
ncbi:MAG: hypothetical protein ACE5IY_01940 [bacterium]